MIFGAGQLADEPTCRGHDSDKAGTHSDPPIRQPGPTPSDDLSAATGIIYGVLFGLLVWAFILGAIFHVYRR